MVSNPTTRLPDGQSGARRRGRPALNTDQPVDEGKCLAIALEVFAEFGFEGTSVREIARRGAISHGLLNAKYGSKLGLWQAAVDHGMELLIDRMSAGDPLHGATADLLERLHEACTHFLLGVADCPAIFRIMTAEGAIASDRLGYVVKKFFQQRSWPFVMLLREGQERGLLREVHPVVPFTLLANGGGALVVLRPLIEAIDQRFDDPSAGIAAAARDAAGIIVRGLLA